MLPDLFGKKVKDDFVVLDSVFPQKEPLAFRNSEINEYLKKIKNFSSYTMYPMKPGPEAWFEHGYGVEQSVFDENKEGYSNFYPENSDRIHYLSPAKKYSFKLAYTFFLAETYVLLPFLEKNNIPFVFVLYPGGSFGLDNEDSDAMLMKILTSKCFRKVIVTQPNTEKYLKKKNFCNPDKISYIYGGFVQFKMEDVLPRNYFKESKETLDVCFVAAKYSEHGVDKGYDLFIEAAKRLAKKSDAFRFHVVGGFDEKELDVSSLKSKITFYGYRKPDFLRKLYADMDIFLSPGRPNKLYKGNFDGFPLGIDAGYCGSALFVTDELKINAHYKDGKDIVIINLDPAAITERIMYFHDHPDELKRIAAEGQVNLQKLFDIDSQINSRMEIFSEFVELKYA